MSSAKGKFIGGPAVGVASPSVVSRDSPPSAPLTREHPVPFDDLDRHEKIFVMQELSRNGKEFDIMDVKNMSPIEIRKIIDNGQTPVSEMLYRGI